MTQEFVTLPREVVEQALDSLLNEGGFRKLLKPFIEKSIESIREALEQPQECYDQRDPLADQQIDAIAESMPGGLDGFLKGWGWRQFARAVLEAAPQPPTTEQSSAVVEECLTDELKPRFSAHDDAERLKSVARGMSYNDHGEAVWKHTLMEIAVRLESGGYAAPQPPALEQQVEKESTCKDSLQVEQEPYAWHYTNNGGASAWHMGPSNRLDADMDAAKAYPKVHRVTPLYTQPQPRIELTGDEARRIYSEATYHASLAVFMTRMDAEHPDADDKGVSGWLQEAEYRVKSRTIDAAHEIGQAAAPQQGEQEPVAIPDECPHIIWFDDSDMRPMMFAARGARDAALRAFDRVSVQWNAHLFVRIQKNSRDDQYPCAPLYTNPQPKREPLTDEQILHYGPGEEGAVWSYEDQLYFARAIEAAHNIK